MSLDIENVTKEYNKKVLYDINLKMDNGVYGLLGPNGAGKSTLIRIVCNIESPTYGKVLYNGVPVSELGENYREVIGYVPQKGGYYPEFTTYEFMDYMAAIKGICRTDRMDRIGFALDTVNLTNMGRKKIKNFSGGMKQKLNIAQAIINRPKILILDEPTVGLDLEERMHFKQFIAEYAEKNIVIFATHIVSDIEDIGNEIIFLKNGKVKVKAESEKLLYLLDGKVWECICSKEELEILRKKYKISNTKSKGAKVEIRLVSKEKPIDGAISVEGTLQDLYLYFFDGNI